MAPPSVPPSHPINNAGAAGSSPQPLPTGSPPLTARAWAWMVGSSIALTLVLIAIVAWMMPPARIQIGLPGGLGPQLTLQTPGFEKDKIILVMGTDINYDNRDHNNSHGARTDTMMLVRVSPSQKAVSIVSIPRDSKVYMAENHGVDKINAAHALGGPELAVHTVQEAFGIPIDHYMVINFKGVHELVDALGGVRVFIEKPLRYRDNTAHLNIDLKPGYQDLDGKTMEGYLRFRHDALADIGRIRRQQQFMSAVAEKIKSPWIIAKIPSLVSLGSKYVQTDMNTDDLFKLTMLLKDVNMNAMRVATLPGHASGGPVSYWIIDPQPAQSVLDRLILNAPLASSDRGVSAENVLTVGLLYSASASDRLATVVEGLTRKGFKVTCKTLQARRNTLFHQSTMIEHTQRLNEKQTETIREVDASLLDARLVFSPVGTTYEDNTCSPNEDITLVLGDLPVNRSTMDTNGQTATVPAGTSASSASN